MRALLWVSIGLAAALGACSGSLSGNMTGTGGAGALTGSGTGTGGKVTSGAGGTAGYNPAVCQALSAEYDAAMTAARSCTTAGSTTECNQPAISSLSYCGACPSFVTDASKLNAIQQMWHAANCDRPTPAPQCPVSGACPSGVPDVCIPGPNGQGLCTFATGSGAMNGGTGGSIGTGGSTGAGGSVVDGGELDVCGAYAIKYATVLDAAKSCTFGVPGQCAQSVAPSLDTCTAGCTVYVNDASDLNLIRQLWNQAGCNRRAISCPLILCIPADSSFCSQTDGGGGTCLSGSTLPP